MTRHGGITREGSRWLRWAAVEVAMTHIKYDVAITRADHRIAERKGRQIAIVIATRKPFFSYYPILKTCRPFHSW